MKIGDAIETAVDYIAENAGTSFVELRRVWFGENEEAAKGSGALILEKSNIVLWSDMSEDFLCFAEALLRSNRVVCKPCPVLVYMVDGGMLCLPLAKRPPKNGYKKLHWMPITFYTPEAFKQEYPDLPPLTFDHWEED